MKKHQFVIWTLLFIILSFKTNAQGAEKEREYTAQREAAARAADNKAHINSAYSNNAPNSSGTGSRYNSFSTVDERYAKRRQAEEQKAREIAATSAFNKEWIRKREVELAEISKGQAASNERVENAKNIYRNYGYFNSDDIVTLTFGLVDNNGRLLAYPKYRDYPQHYAAYKLMAETGSYDEVMNEIFQFKDITGASVTALNKLMLRFPAFKDEINLAKIKAWAGGGVSRHTLGWFADFDAVVKQYPQEAQLALENSKILSITLYYSVNDEFKGMSAADLALNIAIEKWYVQFTPYQEIESSWFQHTKEYLDALSAEEILVLAKLKKVSGARLVLHQHDLNMYAGFLTLRGGYGSYYAKNKENYMTPLQAEKIKFLAYHGDTEAGPIHALRTLQGWTNDKPSDCYHWFQEAADADAYLAKYNLGQVTKVYHIKPKNK